MTDLEKHPASGHFRVVVFGSSRIKPGDKGYDEVFRLGKAIGERGFDIVTGGGPGTMEAANLGHKEGASGKDLHSIGLNIKLPHEQYVNAGVNVMHEHARFSTRLDEFMSLAHVVVVTEGGIGTLLELFYTWQLIQVKHIDRIPIILVGSMWKRFLDWMQYELLLKGMFDEKDLRIVKCVTSYNEAITLIDAWYKVWSESDSRSAREAWDTFII